MFHLNSHGCSKMFEASMTRIFALLQQPK